MTKQKSHRNEQHDQQLTTLRHDIDAVDQQLLRLINERASCAVRIAQLKREHHQTLADPAQPLQFYRPEREAQLLQHLKQCNQGPLTDATTQYLFRELMSACLALEKPLEVAYLGPEGTFTQAASYKHFGHAISTAPQTTIHDVFTRVESGQCDYGVVPVENSNQGMVNHTLDNFIHSPLTICGEIELRIQLYLLANSDADIGSIQTICAHQQALEQARRWLDQHWPNAQRVAVSSNAEAAKKAMQDATFAAIASDKAAESYQLVTLAGPIEDSPNNTTRFLVLGRQPIAPSGNDKTTMMIAAHNKPGVLFHLLQPFKKAGVSLTRIDTRPSQTQKWTYLFFIECEGHQEDAVLQTILHELEEKSIQLKLLGSYPKVMVD